MTETYKNMAIEAAQEAGEAILSVYRSNEFSIELKNDDSPLTIADHRAHKIIAAKLKQTGLPLLSEEGASIAYDQRKSWKTFWMVDPLDGTKEFIKKNGEFTVNIALIKEGKPIFGVVYAPVLDKLYYGGPDIGAFMRYQGKTIELQKTVKNTEIARVVASRSHLNKETKDFIDSFEKVETVSMGSSLKFMVLAEGKADYYPRFAPTMEWDTAAAQAIVTAIGFEVKDPNSGVTLVYNKKNLLNPYFLVS